MATKQDVTTFHSGEDIIIELFAKTDDGDKLPAPGDEEITIVIGTRRGNVVLRENASPQVSLTDSGEAHWTIRLDATDDLTVITPGVAYRYNIWSQNSVTGVEYLQARGRLVYQPSLSADA